ncbi:g13341 [Coccomyxa viridis]|uniref:G13341 protein n=1 Tax=Coccomyxa viridis TaxID=1274662 RepID=A0ABP1GJP1_9CHLO
MLTCRTTGIASWPAKGSSRSHAQPSRCATGSMLASRDFQALPSLSSHLPYTSGPLLPGPLDPRDYPPISWGFAQDLGVSRRPFAPLASHHSNRNMAMDMAGLGVCHGSLPSPQVQYNPSVPMAQTSFRRPMRPMRKSIWQSANYDNVRRTIYICDIASQVTEAEVAQHFADCGQIMDCRVCGDPNSAMRFAFIEFKEEASVMKALQLNWSLLGSHRLRVTPSKTAIVPVKSDFLPRTKEERALCARTVYVANIDKKVDKEDVLAYFEKICGHVTKCRLLFDYHRSTSIAFVEFAQYESAKNALDCSGALMGTMPIRVTPSKAPVRDEA